MNPQGEVAAYSLSSGTAMPTGAAPLDDGALVRAMAAGDERALGALYDRWQPVLHSLVLHIVGDARDAEEVLEDAFWQAWRQAGGYDASRGTVRAWLTTLARSRALDRIRVRVAARNEAPLDEAARQPAAGGATPAEAAETEQMRRIIRAAVDTLPPEQRETMEMAYFRGLSQSEIAEATGQPLGTVKTRARLALQKLRTSLAALREDAP